MREEIVAYIRERQPHAMPKLRVELPGTNGAVDAPALTEERIARVVAESDGKPLPKAKA